MSVNCKLVGAISRPPTLLSSEFQMDHIIANKHLLCRWFSYLNNDKNIQVAEENEIEANTTMYQFMPPTEYGGGTSASP